MACSCKKANKLQKEYGVEEYGGHFSKVVQLMWKVIFFFIIIGLSVVIVPVMFFAVIYHIFFKTGHPLILPPFLSKYLK